MDVDSRCSHRLLRFLVVDTLRMGKTTGRYCGVCAISLCRGRKAARLATGFLNDFFPFGI